MAVFGKKSTEGAYVDFFSIRQKGVVSRAAAPVVNRNRSKWKSAAELPQGTRTDFAAVIAECGEEQIDQTTARLPRDRGHAQDRHFEQRF